ncbi:hypothetical protein BDY19DRAFT_998685 [Irpex rosettiformis]|uniref:Uncharacterized protein n=1 Tax=Irpex rosettiformis TaxID=378272 RepID=A0ACB8TMT4_9APHY|nr:hypothetical protein BDY19DRAFT_998685 [Irpex rosettiformis]
MGTAIGGRLTSLVSRTEAQNDDHDYNHDQDHPTVEVRTGRARYATNPRTLATRASARVQRARPRLSLPRLPHLLPPLSASTAPGLPPIGCAALVSIYDLPPCTPMSPFPPDPTQQPVKHNHTEEYASRITPAAHHIQSLLGPLEKKKLYSTPASKLSAAYANQAWTIGHSGSQQHREVISGWTDGWRLHTKHELPFTLPLSAVPTRRVPQPQPPVLPPITHLDQHPSRISPVTPPQADDASQWYTQGSQAVKLPPIQQQPPAVHKPHVEDVSSHPPICSPLSEPVDWVMRSTLRSSCRRGACRGEGFQALASLASNACA